MGALKKNVVRPILQMLEACGWPYDYVRSGTDARLEIGSNTYYLYGANTEASQDALQGLTAAGAYLDEAALFPKSFVDQAIGTHKQSGIPDMLEMLLIVQLIEITPDSAALCAGQLHCIGQYLVTGLFSIELPCVVLPGAFQENVTLPKTVCPRGPGHPQQSLVHGLIAGGGPLDNAFVNKE